MNRSAKKAEDSRHGHRQRLRERYAAAGISALADYEIAEMMLTLLIPRADVKPAAKELIKKFGNIRGILDAPAEDLEAIDGIGAGAATMIGFIKDLIGAYHYCELETPSTEIATISKLMRYFKTRLASKATECLEMVCFDTQLKIIASVRLFEGSVNRASVDIRRIVETALKAGATSIAIAHNHPSGAISPSLEDIRFTQRLSAACRAIRINMIEHIIVGKNACYSFRRDGRFDDLYDDSLAESRLRGASRVAEEKRRIV